jgi:patatin-like phospholipase/acyl hydrolase
VEGLSKKKKEEFPSGFFFIDSIQARRDPLLNAQLRHVCRATSAAPTYFPPVQFSVVDKTKEPPESREYHMIDGGIAVNNPVKNFFHPKSFISNFVLDPICLEFRPLDLNQFLSSLFGLKCIKKIHPQVLVRMAKLGWWGGDKCRLMWQSRKLLMRFNRVP